MMDAFITIPLDTLKTLLDIAEDYPKLMDEVKVLSRRLDGCYALASQAIEKIADIRRP